mgnify:CR=1 FL=1|tara:strand:+ start:631 stop:1047 length:417 start_codon:yes stop_codon:yes gene_type:complete
MSLVFYVENEQNLDHIANLILSKMSHKKKFIFYGEMGIGKTTLIKALSLHLGVEDLVHSPTFSIVNQYIMKNGKYIYHFDFYRIEAEKEAYDIGFEDYLYSDEYCFIEWPEKITGLLDEDMVSIYMYFEDKQRKIEVK